MAAAFNPFPAVLRGSAAHVHRDISFDAPHTTLIHKNDTLVEIDQERPPALPYTWQVCSSNTFTCSDSTVSPQALQQKVKEIIRISPADVSSSSDWEFHAVFYPEEVKTAFTVSIFDSETQKNSCIVEMQLQEGDRVAFQHLVSYVRSQANLKYAFASEWGFEEDDEESDKWDAGYKHTSFAPLPLPKSLLAELDLIDVQSPFNDSKNCLADILLENACSQYADVRRTGWVDLANESNKNAFATSLLEASAHGQECVSLAITELQGSAICGVTADTHRCVLKTLLNIAKTGNGAACRKIYGLKPQILKLAAVDKSNSTETQATAVQLMQCLVHGKFVDKDFVSALTDRSRGKCRVSGFARDALSSLKSLKLIST